ncbi:hypothetical protein GN316_15350 [Xylophilus sp. Kf1]|nr:hypothetical protein [Xylophilus sp. Kf1]
MVNRPQTGGSYSRDPVTGALTLMEQVEPALPVLRHDALVEAAPSDEVAADIAPASATQQKAD